MVLGIIHCNTDKESNHILGEQLFVLVMHHFNPHKIPQYEFVPILKTTHHYAHLVTHLCKKIYDENRPQTTPVCCPKYQIPYIKNGQGMTRCKMKSTITKYFNKYILSTDY